jgi:hypothetical protein
VLLLPTLLTIIPSVLRCSCFTLSGGRSPPKLSVDVAEVATLRRRLLSPAPPAAAVEARVTCAVLRWRVLAPVGEQCDGSTEIASRLPTRRDVTLFDAAASAPRREAAPPAKDDMSR